MAHYSVSQIEHERHDRRIQPRQAYWPSNSSQWAHRDPRRTRWLFFIAIRDKEPELETSPPPGSESDAFERVAMTETALVVELASDTDADSVNLINPNGEMNSLQRVQEGATQVTFQLLGETEDGYTPESTMSSPSLATKLSVKRRSPWSPRSRSRMSSGHRITRTWTGRRAVQLGNNSPLSLSRIRAMHQRISRQ